MTTPAQATTTLAQAAIASLFATRFANCTDVVCDGFLIHAKLKESGVAQHIPMIVSVGGVRFAVILTLANGEAAQSDNRKLAVWWALVETATDMLLGQSKIDVPIEYVLGQELEACQALQLSDLVKPRNAWRAEADNIVVGEESNTLLSRWTKLRDILQTLYGAQTFKGLVCQLP